MDPVFGWAMGRLDDHIDRSKPRRAWNKVAEQGATLHARATGSSCSPRARARAAAGAYKTGATRLAITVPATPVVPIADDLVALLAAQASCCPGVVDVSIGRPIAPAGREPDEMMREVERWIETEMRRLDPEAYIGGAPAAQPRKLRAHAARPHPPTPSSSRCSTWRCRRTQPADIPAPCAVPPRPSPRRPLRRRRTTRRPSATRRPTARSACASTWWPTRFKRVRRRSIGFIVGAEGPVGERAALGRPRRHREPRCAREPTGSCASCASSGAQPSLSSSAHRLARRRGRALPRRDGARWCSTREPPARCSTTMRRPLPGVPRLTLHVGLPHHRAARADPRCGAELAAAPGAAHLPGARRAFRRTARRALHAPRALRRRRRAGAAPVPTARCASTGGWCTSRCRPSTTSSPTSSPTCAR